MNRKKKYEGMTRDKLIDVVEQLGGMLKREVERHKEDLEILEKHYTLKIR